MNGMNARTGKPLDGVDHLLQSVADILGTPLGSRVARRDYGSIIPELLDQPLNELGRTRIYAAAALALLRQERRLRTAKFTLRRGDRPGSATLIIDGRRTDTKARNTGVSLSVPLRALSALSA